VSGDGFGSLSPSQQKWLAIFPKEWGTIPCFHPSFRDGMPVQMVMALERRGLIERRHVAAWFSPFDGLKSPAYQWRTNPNN